ncbi:TPA: efflux transporter outer membrane subunit [Burkholderia vietnamiensis]|nr:efflux transporter outer membrane subunit [Burkholderia vietnamiensis]
MNKPNSSLRRKLPGISALCLALGVAGLAGCAQLPDLPQPATLKPPAAFNTAASLPASDKEAWPSDNWWTNYGDPQLNALIDDALKDSPGMAIASARLAQAQALRQVAAAPLYPQVNATGSVTKSRMSYDYLTPANMSPHGWPAYGQTQLNLDWEIDFWGKHRAELAAATSQLKASQAEYAQVRLMLSATLASDYAKLAELFAQRDTAQHSVDIRRKSVELVAQRQANGLETSGALEEAKSRLATAEGNLMSVDEHIGLQRHLLAALMGEGPDRGLSIQRPSLKLEQVAGLPETLPVDLLGRRPDIVAAREMAEASAQQVKAKKAAFYPNVNLTGMLGLQSLGLNMLLKSGSVMGAVGPAVTLPIFTGGQLRGELRSAAAAYDQSVALYNATLTAALREVADAWLSKEALAGQLEKAKEAVSAADAAYVVAQNRYKGGLANYLEVLQAEDTLLASQDSLTGLQSRAASLDIALKRALGGGYQQSAQSHNKA